MSPVKKSPNTIKYVHFLKMWLTIELTGIPLFKFSCKDSIRMKNKRGLVNVNWLGLKYTVASVTKHYAEVTS